MSTVSSQATIDWISSALSGAGFHHDPRTLEVRPRDGRVAVRLLDDRMAWFPVNAEGRVSMLKERRVLRLLEAHCRFSAPRVVHEDESGWDLRSLVPGIVNPVGFRERILADSVFAAALGNDLGQVLAEQHTRIPRIELEGWLPVVPNWPRPEDLPYLPQVVDDPMLLARVERALRRRADTVCAVDESVLVHADLGLHNIALDPVSHRLAGLFDYEGAVFGDRHQDFVYMIFQRTEEPMLDGAIGAYERATGVTIDRDRVQLLNALAAIGFLAFRHGHSPEEDWCGRTLAMDLAWTEDALNAAGL
jgi:aminoglycoside phosphotransferase (APT) family kinase protein